MESGCRELLRRALAIPLPARPKIGLELGARPDFAPLGDPDLATISLGIKTGCDGFFFLTECGRATSAGRVRLRGLGNWEGEFSKNDVLPGIQAPRELDTQEGRRAVIPRGGTSYYLYPRITAGQGSTRVRRVR